MPMRLSLVVTSTRTTASEERNTTALLVIRLKNAEVVVAKLQGLLGRKFADPEWRRLPSLTTRASVVSEDVSLHEQHRSLLKEVMVQSILNYLTFIEYYFFFPRETNCGIFLPNTISSYTCLSSVQK